MENQNIQNTIQEPISEPVPVFVDQPKAKNNWIISIIFMVLGIFVGICSLLLFQKYISQDKNSTKDSPTEAETQNTTTNPTANWKVYTNTKGGYSYSYPNDWTNSEGLQNDSTAKDPSSKYPDGEFSVAYYDKDYCVSEAQSIRKYNWVNFVESQILVSNNKGILITGLLDFNDNLQHTRSFILVTNNDSCYEITTWSYQNSKHEAIFDQILSTFKFNGDNTSSNATTNWKIYTYQAYSIKFPSNWITTDTKNPTQFLNYSINSADGRSYDSSTDGNKLKVEIYQESTNDSLDTFLARKKASNVDIKGDTVWITSKTTISGVEAVKVKTSNPGFVYYVKDTASNSIFSIAFTLNFDNSTDLANQILSTFKFSK